MMNAISKPRSPGLSAAVATVVTLAIGGWVLTPVTRSQAPATSTNNAALTALITKIKDQQDQMAANQTKIEAQTAQLQEAIRQAKIYSARGGSGHR